MYYKFDSMSHFNEWHQIVKQILGIPMDDGITTEYTQPIIIEENQIIAFSDEEYAENLIPIEYKPKDSFS